VDAKVKAIWVEALRSGVYTQAQGSLKRGDSYCCLGVLCDVTGNGYFELIPGFNVSEGLVSLGVDGETVVFGLPGELRKQFNIPAASVCQLAHKNDTGSTFAEIADWIEANL
jgi:hypothetical protein